MWIEATRRLLVAKSALTESELISTLQHSSLPTLLTEGRDDLILLRRFEDLFTDAGLSVLPAGGREIVLKTFARRGEISAEKTLLFLADVDTWIHSGLPREYLHPLLLFTDGYSIENDLYRDGELERLLLPKERLAFLDELDRFLSWYALALSRHLKDLSVQIGVHPNALFASDEHYTSSCNLIAGEVYPTELRDELRGDYRRVVRGKSLICLLLRQLSAANRTPKYSAKSLLEIGATAGGYHSGRIARWLSSHLEPTKPATKC